MFGDRSTRTAICTFLILVEMFELTEEEAVGQNVTLLMPPSIRPQHAGYIRRFLDSGEKKMVYFPLSPHSFFVEDSFLQVGAPRELRGVRHQTGENFPIEISLGERLDVDEQGNEVLLSPFNHSLLTFTYS